MLQRSIPVQTARILILGITFKENCPDIRNTRTTDVRDELLSYDIPVDVYDPWASNTEVIQEFGFNLIPTIESKYEAVILCVAHDHFLSADWRTHLTENGIVYDVKGVLPDNHVDGRL